MFIKQISVFLENHNGALREMTELLGKGGIDLLALSVADTQNFGIIRIIVSSEQADAALLSLRDNGYVAKMNQLGLCELLSLIEKAGLSVEYMYSFLRASKGGEAHMILRLSDGKKAAELFQKQNVKTLSQEDVDAL